MRSRLATDLMQTVAQLSPNAIIALDGKARVDLWSAAAESILGWKSTEVVGKPLPQPIAAIAAEETRHGGAEVVVRARDGSLRRLEIRAAPHGTEGWLFIATDCSHEKAAAERLRTESRFRELLEAAPDAIIEVDSEGRIRLLNRVTEKLFGYSREELLGMNVDALLPDALRGAHTAHRETYWSDPATRPMGRDLILSARRKDGQDIPVEISLSPVETVDGFRVTAIIRDVSERRTAEEKLRAANQQLEARNSEIERANQLKSEFLASMSHELRTPLHTIIGFTELLAEELEGPLNEKQKRFVQHVRQDSLHLLELINDILDLSKIEAGRMELEIESLDAREVARSAVGGILNAARAKNINLENRLHDACFVLADRLRLREILTNLLSNAVKFTPAGGSVWIEGVEDPGARVVRFTVGDTGIGISPDDQSVIFDKFRQVASTTRGIREGTGLGLAIVKQLVELHGGQVAVESTPGIGSRFSFTIPADPARLRSQPLVLIVEDEIAGRELLASYLNPLGVRTEFAGASSVATALARDLRPDAITLDLLMPGRSGWRVLEELRALPETRAIPVFVISVLDRDRDAMALGATAYLQKPVKKETLVQAMRDHVPAVSALSGSALSNHDARV